MFPVTPHLLATTDAQSAEAELLATAVGGKDAG
jgi:hypothetical protein